MTNLEIARLEIAMLKATDKATKHALFTALMKAKAELELEILKATYTIKENN